MTNCCSPYYPALQPQQIALLPSWSVQCRLLSMFPHALLLRIVFDVEDRLGVRIRILELGDLSLLLPLEVFQQCCYEKTRLPLNFCSVRRIKIIVLKGHCQWITCAVTVSPLTDFESITFEVNHFVVLLTHFGIF